MLFVTVTRYYDCNLLAGQTVRCAPTSCTGLLCWTPAPSPSGRTTHGRISTMVSTLKGIVHVAHLMYDLGSFVKKINTTLLILANAKIKLMKSSATIPLKVPKRAQVLGWYSPFCFFTADWVCGKNYSTSTECAVKIIPCLLSGGVKIVLRLLSMR